MTARKLMFFIFMVYILSACVSRQEFDQLHTEVVNLRTEYERTLLVNDEIRKIPDLIISDISYKDPYIFVSYSNQGLGQGEGDFLIRLTNSRTQKSFKGNSYSRFRMLEPNQEEKTGGFSAGLIGLKKGDVGVVTAEIDWEDRVYEANERNNMFTKKIRLE